jgi:ABC-2 type transport system ATP-binding protein
VVSETAISLKGIYKDFPTGVLGRKRREVLRGLDLEVKRGEVFGYIGPNGAGKTTTIGVVLGLVKPTAGTVSVLGRPAGDHLGRSRLGSLPEQPYFYPHLTARELLDYYGRLYDIPAERRKAKASSLLELLGLEKHAHVRLNKYSRGMLQRFAIAQSLMNDPELLIFDEPFSGLDPIGRKDMMRIMLDLKSKGKTIFFSTHILSDVQYLADRVGLIAGGRIIRIIDGEEFKQKSTDEMEVELRGVGSDGMDALRRIAQEVIAHNGKTIFVVRGNESLTRVIEYTLQKGYQVERIVPRLKFLEEVFSQEMEGVAR